MILLGFTCILATILTLNNVGLHHLLANSFPVEYPWQILSGIFVHGIAEGPPELNIGHLVSNLLFVIPFGILVEKVIGNNRFSVLTIATWVMQSILFLILSSLLMPGDETTRNAGISGLGFLFGTVGAYILFRLFVKNRKVFFKQILIYFYLLVLLVMVITLNPFMGGWSPFFLHLSGVISGIVFILISRKYIDANICALMEEDRLMIKSSKTNWLWLIAPVFFVVMLVIFR